MRSVYNDFLTIMYSVWNFDPEESRVPRTRATTDHAEQERDRLTKTNELVSTFMKAFSDDLPPLSASEELSILFRQRGVPSLDAFTRTFVGAFRRSMGFNPAVDGLERKFMTLTRWRTTNAVATMWTVEPVVSSTVIRGNSINVRTASDTYSPHLEWIEPMSMTTHSTIVKPGNEIRGRWAGWLVWMAAREAGGDSMDSVCSTCNMSSTLFGFSMETTSAKLIHLAMTPETVMMVGRFSERLAPSMNVTISVTTHGSTKMSIRPSMSVNRNSSLRLFGNGSMQFCGSPTDIEDLFKAAVKMVRRTMESNVEGFLSSLRQMRSPTG